jgi:hypothetical protein
VIGPKSLQEFEILKREAVKAASETADAHIQNWTRFVIGWDELHRGRIKDARASAQELMQVGRMLGDPRSTGLGLALLTWIALVSDSYAEARDYSEQSLAVAVTPLDRAFANSALGCALVLLRRTEEGLKQLEDSNHRCVVDGDLYTLTANEGIIAVCRGLQGNVGDGIRLLEEAISRREKEGYRDVADWYRFFLCEVFLQIIAGNEKLAFPILLKNLPIILKVVIIAPSRIRHMMTSVFNNPHWHPEGHYVGRGQMILGLLYKAKKKRALAVHHLTHAQCIFSQFGQTPILARVEAALAELRQQA